ncbi:nuclear transport factor 2 family protein [Pseudomarimonas salicorniae]|uniref:Nuclear transport factor 2 family protein n=1 Tax=Pseudomarimonas salicorniae TaxID=2933270 RepID=A0ABT0GKM6_9GAMM|nr:nuclear transport factor 2 family protein [Lysobacter sp. CAU 1642]MCK7595086.1 nuclear transport factor 2 family protein [Lysobacter sp. CAU 1642]
MRLRTLFPATLGLLVLAGQSMAAPPADLDQRVKRFVQAANQHDVEAMVGAVEPGFRWMHVEGERISVEVVGPDQLRSWLEGYFRTTPSARSTLGAVQVDGAYASTVEFTEYLGEGDVMQRQSATCVYQFSEAGLIRNVWYFPAQEAAAAEPPAVAP